MRRILISTVIGLALLFLYSCSDNSTSNDTDPEPEPEPTTGAIEITTNTTGDDVDTDGYTATAGSGNSTDIKLSETKYISDIEEGVYTLELQGVASNCDPEGDNPREVPVFSGDTTSVNFNIGCDMVAEDKIVFHSNRDGDYDIYMMNTDGSNIFKLTDNSADNKYPSFSNDGTEISYVSDYFGNITLKVMKVDGSNERTLSSADGSSMQSWSPDDSKIVFDKSYGIYKINSDGSGETFLRDGKDPSWSPDGDRIAFREYSEFYTMNTSGSDTSKIAGFSSSNPDTTYVPDWSPDGNTFAASLLEDGYEDIYTVGTDGNGYQRITNMDGSDESHPSWSPDGSELVIQSDRGSYPDTEIYILSSDGSGNMDQLTRNNSEDGAPDWSPVGQ